LLLTGKSNIIGTICIWPDAQSRPNTNCSVHILCRLPLVNTKPALIRNNATNELINTYMRKRSIIPILALLSSSVSATTSLWVEPKDTQLRHHIQLLADTGVINIPMTTWPLMWSSLDNALTHVDTAGLNGQQLYSYNYLKSASQQSVEDAPHYRVRANVQTYPSYFGGAAQNDREKAGLNISADGTKGRVGWQLQASLVDSPQDGDNVRLDGSYLAGRLGNWTVTAGAVERWWGPGWQDSLILSNNARPVPAISLQRNHLGPFETPLLSWMGPWQLTAFAGQLEDDRHIPDAKLLGLRFTLRPLSSLELGFYRTAQWGGEGRPESMDSFWDLLTGQDNLNWSDPDFELNNEPGNQLGGMDWRWSFQLPAITAAFYGQLTGEDETSGLPSRFAVQLGMDSAFTLKGMQNRIRFELVDTGGEGAIDAERINYIYEHRIYQSGYRYKGRPLGASIDNDSRQYILAADHYLDKRYSFNWVVSYIELNRDGTDWPLPAGNPLSSSSQTLWHINLGATRYYRNFEVSAGLDYLSEELEVHGQKIGHFSPKLAVEYQF